MNKGALFAAAVFFAIGFAAGYYEKVEGETNSDARVTRGIKWGGMLMLIAVFIWAIFGSSEEQ
jgi:hypothetical protein